MSLDIPLLEKVDVPWGASKDLERICQSSDPDWNQWVECAFAKADSLTLAWAPEEGALTSTETQSLPPFIGYEWIEFESIPRLIPSPVSLAQSMQGCWQPETAPFLSLLEKDLLGSALGDAGFRFPFDSVVSLTKEWANIHQHSHSASIKKVSSSYIGMYLIPLLSGQENTPNFVDGVLVPEVHESMEKVSVRAPIDRVDSALSKGYQILAGCDWIRCESYDSMLIDLEVILKANGIPSWVEN